MPEDNPDFFRMLERIKQLSQNFPQKPKAVPVVASEPDKSVVLLAAISFKIAEVASDAASARAAGEMSEEKFSGVKYVTEKLMALVKEVATGSPQ